jgi:uncharacterized protein (TIGR02391 family)
LEFRRDKSVSTQSEKEIAANGEKIARNVKEKYKLAFNDDGAYFGLWRLTESYLKDYPDLGAQCKRLLVIVTRFRQAQKKACMVKYAEYDRDEAHSILQFLHPDIMRVAAKLFMDGHYAESIFEAYKALEVAVRTKSRVQDLDGQKLMAKAFGGERPLLALNQRKNKSDRDEQDGFMHIYMGVMTGIRNPKAHEIIEQEDVNKTIEYLAMASLLMRRIEETRVVPSP